MSRYLLITYKRQPGGQIDEQVGFSRRVRNSDYDLCNVIMDYKLRKVEKCVIEGRSVPTHFEALNEYYAKVYPQLIKQMEQAQQEDSDE